MSKLGLATVDPAYSILQPGRLHIFAQFHGLAQLFSSSDLPPDRPQKTGLGGTGACEHGIRHKQNCILEGQLLMYDDKPTKFGLPYFQQETY